MSWAGWLISAFSAARPGSGRIATLGGAILQRWQSGNLRSYAAWLAAGAAVVLLFALLLDPYSPGTSCIRSFMERGTEHERN